jgi:hypothetical protein
VCEKFFDWPGGKRLPFYKVGLKGVPQYGLGGDIGKSQQLNPLTDISGWDFSAWKHPEVTPGLFLETADQSRTRSSHGF